MGANCNKFMLIIGNLYYFHTPVVIGSIPIIMMHILILKKGAEIYLSKDWTNGVCEIKSPIY